MCARRIKIPKTPDPRPIAPMPEKTAGALTTGKNRKGRRSGKSRSFGSGGKNTSIGSLRIPLKEVDNLRYG